MFLLLSLKFYLYFLFYRRKVCFVLIYFHCIIDYLYVFFMLDFTCLCIYLQVKIIKCLVENIVVDISFNQLGGLCTLCFLEEVNGALSNLVSC